MRVHHEVIQLTSHLKFLRSVRSVCMCLFLVPSHKSTVQSQRADRASTCYMLSHCVTSDSATPWTVARHAPLSMGFSRQEYWSGLSCPPQRDLPNPGTEPTSPAWQAGSSPLVPPGKPSPWAYLDTQNLSQNIASSSLVARRCIKKMSFHSRPEEN